MQTRFRLLPTVVVCVCTLVLVSAGSIFVLHLLTAKTLVSDLVGRVVVRGLSGLELALEGHLDPARYQTQFIASAIRDGDFDDAEREDVAAFAEGSFAAAPQLSVLVVADALGNVLRVARAPGGELEREWLNPKPGSPLDAIAGETRARKHPYWGPPVFSPFTGETLLNLRVPIWRDDTYLGFTAAGISTAALSQLALELSEPPRSTVFVIYRDKVLGHMYMALRTPGLSPEKPLLGTGEIIDPVIGRLGDAKPFEAAGLTLPKDIKVLELESGGTDYLIVTKPVSGYGDAPLVLGAYSVLSEVDSPFRTVSRAVTVGAALLVFALAMAVLMSRMITRPIRQTSDRVAAIAALEFDSVVPLRRSWIREIDDLAGSFNAMLVGLKSFQRYVPRALVTRLIREKKVGAGTEERDITVMFTDIAGFTPICEGMIPAEVADFINHHLTMVSSCIEREGGTIDKYIGDAVMAFWGAPDRIDDAPVRAVRAAMAIQAAIRADNETRATAGLLPVRIRIGIHSGPLIVGDIGSPNRINYTVVGDVVNAAQRLEGLGKEVDPEAESIVLVSEATRAGLGDSVALAEVGHFKVKGKQEELEVFRVVADETPAPE